MSDFLFATFLFIVYMSFVSWGLSSPQPELPKLNPNAPTIADYAAAFAVEPEIEQPALPSLELNDSTLPDPWESASTSQTFENESSIVSVSAKDKPIILLPPAPQSTLEHHKCKKSKSKRTLKALNQTGNRFTSMNTRQLKQEAGTWNKLHPKQKIKELGKLSKAKLIESLLALSA